MIGNNVSNVESAIVQVVARVRETGCRSCLQVHGPWAQCVVLDGLLVPRHSQVRDRHQTVRCIPCVVLMVQIFTHVQTVRCDQGHGGRS
jgi:hypothetical protein